LPGEVEQKEEELAAPARLAVGVSGADDTSGSEEEEGGTEGTSAAPARLVTRASGAGGASGSRKGEEGRWFAGVRLL